jgi:predicted nucleic acid-binding protein
MDRVALDTSFLIDLQNERRGRGAPRGATAFLRAHQETELLLPSVALGEYLEGFADPRGPAAQALVSTLTVLEVTADVAELYASVTRSLRESGRLIGTNDLWIACTARAATLPLLTRDIDHFSRVPALELVGYRADDEALP